MMVLGMAGFQAPNACAGTLSEDFKSILTAQSSPPATNLPATDMGAEPAVHHMNPKAAAPGFSHAGIPDNPQAADAKPVGEKVCVACHQLENEHFSQTLHADGLRAASST